MVRYGTVVETPNPFPCSCPIMPMSYHAHVMSCRVIQVVPSLSAEQPRLSVTSYRSIHVIHIAVLYASTLEGRTHARTHAITMNSSHPASPNSATWRQTTLCAEGMNKCVYVYIKSACAMRYALPRYAKDLDNAKLLYWETRDSCFV